MELRQLSSRVLTEIGETVLPAGPRRRRTQIYSIHHRSLFRLAHIDVSIAVCRQSVVPAGVDVT